LQAEGAAHQREGIGGHVRIDVGAEAGQDAVVESLLKGRHPVAHLHLDEAGDRHMGAPVSPDLPCLRPILFGISVRRVADLGNRSVLPARAVDEGHIGPVVAVSGVGRCLDHNGRTANIVVVQRRTERSRELPSGVVGAGRRRPWAASKAEGHQLILGVEIRLRDAPNALRRIVDRAWKLVRHTLSAAVGASRVGIDHPAPRVHQTPDHRVGVLGRVRRLRGIGSGRNPLADLA
jgi:hypothetical protein